jgi:hypothetical protein
VFWGGGGLGGGEQGFEGGIVDAGPELFVLVDESFREFWGQEGVCGVEGEPGDEAVGLGIEGLEVIAKAGVEVVKGIGLGEGEKELDEFTAAEDIFAGEGRVAVPAEGIGFFEEAVIGRIWQPGGAEEEGSAGAAALDKGGLEEEEFAGVIAKGDGILAGQIADEQGGVFAEHRTVGDAELWEVAIDEEEGGKEGKDGAGAEDDGVEEGGVAGGLAKAAGGFGAEDEEEIADEVADAESAEIVKGEHRELREEVAGAESFGVQGDPGTEGEEDAVGEIEDGGGESLAEFAGIAEGRRPADAEEENGNEG